MASLYPIPSDCQARPRQCGRERQGRGQSRSAGFQAGLDRAEFSRGSVRNSKSRALPNGETVSRLGSQRSPHSEPAANASWGTWICAARKARPVGDCACLPAFCLHSAFIILPSGFLRRRPAPVAHRRSRLAAPSTLNHFFHGCDKRVPPLAARHCNQGDDGNVAPIPPRLEAAGRGDALAQKLIRNCQTASRALMGRSIL